MRPGEFWCSDVHRDSPGGRVEIENEKDRPTGAARVINPQITKIAPELGAVKRDDKGKAKAKVQ
jgi:hypothetical protein